MNFSFELKTKTAAKTFTEYLDSYEYKYTVNQKRVTVIDIDYKDVDNLDRFCRAKQLYPITFYK